MNAHLHDTSAARARETDAYGFVPYAAYLLIALLEVVAIGSLNHGNLFYTLDDAYIHLALAERIGAGTYGINVGEFAAPSSSILWPFLLSAFSSTHFMALVPCAVNLTAALGTLLLMARVVRRALDMPSAELSAVWVSAFIALLVLATNLVPLVFTGMEHSIQLLLAVMIIAGLIEESRTSRTRSYLWVAIVLIPLVRYDSLALAVPALIYLAWRRHLRGSVVASVALFSALLAFSGYLKSNGLGFLPTSVTAKAGFMSGAGAAYAIFLTLYANIVQSTQGNLLLLGCVLLAAAALDRKRSVQDRGLATAIASALLLHLVFGKVGAYYRYEVYVWATALLTLIHLHRERLRVVFRSGSGIASRLAVLGSLAVVSMGYVFALVSTPVAANNIYDQQYQMHRFVVDYYKGPVAVNDLGWVAFQNPYYVLDFAGLGSAEALRARRADPSGQWMERLAREHGVGLILIYDGWFPNHPSSWIRLGGLQLLRPRITPADSNVQFYARDRVSAERARAALADFVRTLPKGAAFAAAPDESPQNVGKPSDRRGVHERAASLRAGDG